MPKTWNGKLTDAQKQQVTRELREFGLDNRQIESLMKFRGKVSEIELVLMRDLPSSSWGRRPTISVVKDAIRTCVALHLVELEKGG